MEQLQKANSKLNRELGVSEVRLQGTVQKHEKEADDLGVRLAASEVKLKRADR